MSSSAAFHCVSIAVVLLILRNAWYAIESHPYSFHGGTVLVAKTFIPIRLQDDDDNASVHHV